MISCLPSSDQVHVVLDSLPSDCSDIGLSVEEMASMHLGEGKSDVTLCLNSKRYGVHQTVLCKRSPFFRGMDGYCVAVFLSDLQHEYE